MNRKAAGVGFRYGKGPRVLRDMDFEVEPGKVVGLSGPSGRGKTTFARVLAGYERPHEGRVVLGGAPLPQRGYSPVQLVFQHPERAVNPHWRLSDTLIEGWDVEESLLDVLGVDPAWLDRYPNE